MRILYIHQYFKIPSEPGGTRSYWISRELLKNGHEVVMVTSIPNDLIKREEKVIDGIRVIYLGEPYSQSMSIWRRVRSFLGFALKSIVEARRQKDIDLVIATSTPLTVGLTSLFMKWFKKVPYVFEVRDLWPEVLIQMGALKNPFLIGIARLFEKTIYRNAEHVITLSPGMQEGVIKYILPERTSMIPNMSKVEEFWPRPKDLIFEKELGFNPNSFKIIHFGSLGLANGVETIIESAKLLKEDSTVEFLFLGDGAIKSELVRKCRHERLDNVKFLGEYSMKETSEIVNLSDISIVSFLDIEILYTNSPNKLFDALSAGKPIIVNSAGWTKDMVEEYNCGYYVNPRLPNELVDKVLYLKSHPEIARQMGINSRRLAETIYDKSILCRQFIDVIEKTLKGYYK